MSTWYRVAGMLYAAAVALQQGGHSSSGAAPLIHEVLHIREGYGGGHATAFGPVAP